jgi:hypothetical protein
MIVLLDSRVKRGYDNESWAATRFFHAHTRGRRGGAVETFGRWYNPTGRLLAADTKLRSVAANGLVVALGRSAPTLLEKT